MFKGSYSEGQRGLFTSLLDHYTEETAAAIVETTNNGIGLSGMYLDETSGASDQQLEKSIIQNNSLLSYNSIENEIDNTGISRSKNTVTNYIVQEGDTLSFIASDYGVSMNSIIWANNLSNIDYLKPGTELKIPPVTGVIHRVVANDTVGSIANKYDAREDKIIEFNKLPKDGSIRIGMEIIIPDGEMSISSNYTASNVKRFDYLPNMDGYFSQPARGFNWGTIHGRNGVDVAASCGTGIYAAAAGDVAISDSAGWNGGFGNYIKIVHPNGTETLYAHNSKNLVSIGEHVYKGQLISYMGTTGRSTGCHVHFEVHGAKNPLAK